MKYINKKIFKTKIKNILLLMFFSFLNLFSLFNLVKFVSDESFQFNNNFLFDKSSKLQLKILNESKFEEIHVNLDFRKKISKKKNGIIQNYNFKNNYFRKVRLSYFKSDDKQMFNSAWYPLYEYECPILTIDIVNFGRNESLFFLNLVEIYKTNDYKKRYINPFLEIKKNYTKFDNNASKYLHLMPFNNFLSKPYLYAKLNKTEIETIVPIVLEKYFTIYLNYFIKRPVDRYYIETKHREYNNFRKNIDSNFIIKEYFDDDWFKRLIIDYYTG